MGAAPLLEICILTVPIEEFPTVIKSPGVRANQPAYDVRLAALVAAAIFVFVSVKAINKTVALKCIQTAVGKEITLPNKTKSATIQLVDIQGRIVDTKANETHNLYCVPNVKTGMYYLFLNNTLAFKLMVE